MTTIKELFTEMNYEISKMEKNKFYEVSGWEILSYKNGATVWADIEKIVRKEDTQEVEISTQSGKILKCSPDHKVYTKSEVFVEVSELIDKNFEILNSYLEWEKATAKYTGKITEILDLQVKDTHCYYAGGILSHNTLHGDPTTTPGGAAVPFHSSVRIQLIGGKKIMSENDKELPIGINITAKIIKNKIAYPYRRAEFEIHFGKGIVETEQFFDHVREQGEIQGDGKENLIEINVSGKKYLAGISGTQAWKYLKVYDGDTGTEVAEYCKNFNKSDFFAVKNDPKYKPIVDAILERLLVLRVEPELTEDFIVQEAEKIEKKILLD